MNHGFRELLRPFEEVTWEEAKLLFPKLNEELSADSWIRLNIFFGLCDDGTLIAVDQDYRRVRTWELRKDGTWR